METTDIRAKLVALLYEHQEDAAFNLDLGRDECRCGEQGTQGWREHFADVLLSLEGVAIVALPEQTIVPIGWGDDCIGAWPTTDAESRRYIDPVSAWPKGEVALPDGDFIPAKKARELAAALLAAADAAEAVK